MTLNEGILGEQIYKELTSIDPSNTKQICIQLAHVIIEHIKKNGEVIVSVQTSAGSGTGSGKMI